MSFCDGVLKANKHYSLWNGMIETVKYWLQHFHILSVIKRSSKMGLKLIIMHGWMDETINGEKDEQNILRKTVSL